MGFEKGHSKVGGRRKGSVNKATSFSKQLFNDITSRYIDSGQLESDLNSLTPKERIDAMLKFVPFIIPKPQAVSFDINTEKSHTIEEELVRLAEEFE